MQSRSNTGAAISGYEDILSFFKIKFNKSHEFKIMYTKKYQIQEDDKEII